MKSHYRYYCIAFSVLGFEVIEVAHEINLFVQWYRASLFEYHHHRHCHSSLLCVFVTKYCHCIVDFFHFGPNESNIWTVEIEMRFYSHRLTCQWKGLVEANIFSAATHWRRRFLWKNINIIVNISYRKRRRPWIATRVMFFSIRPFWELIYIFGSMYLIFLAKIDKRRRCLFGREAIGKWNVIERFRRVEMLFFPLHWLFSSDKIGDKCQSPRFSLSWSIDQWSLSPIQVVIWQQRCCWWMPLGY